MNMSSLQLSRWKKASPERIIDMSGFTKKWRVTHNEPLNYNERIINSACDIIEQQDERIETLEAVIQRCIKAMEGSNCLEEQWLREALKS